MDTVNVDPLTPEEIVRYAMAGCLHVSQNCVLVPKGECSKCREEILGMARRVAVVRAGTHGPHVVFLPRVPGEPAVQSS